MNNEEKDIFDAMKDKLEHKEFDFNPEHWKSMEKLLDEPKPKGGGWFKRISVIGALLLMLSAVVYWVTRTNQTEITEDPLVSQNNDPVSESGKTQSVLEAAHEVGPESVLPSAKNSDSDNSVQENNYTTASSSKDQGSDSDRLDNGQNISTPVNSADLEKEESEEKRFPAPSGKKATPKSSEDALALAQFSEAPKNSQKETATSDFPGRSGKGSSVKIAGQVDATAANPSSTDERTPDPTKEPNLDRGIREAGVTSDSDTPETSSRNNRIYVPAPENKISGDQTDQTDEANTTNTTDATNTTNTTDEYPVDESSEVAGQNNPDNSEESASGNAAFTFETDPVNSANRDQNSDDTPRVDQVEAVTPVPVSGYTMDVNPTPSNPDSVTEQIPPVIDPDESETVASDSTGEEEGAEQVDKKDSIKLTSGLFIVAGTNLYQTYHNLDSIGLNQGKSIDPVVGITFMRDLNKRIGFSLGANYYQKSGLNSFRSFESIYYDFDYRRERTIIRSTRLHFGGIQAGLYVRLMKGLRLNTHVEYNRLITSISQVNTEIESRKDGLTELAPQKEFGYVNGFAPQSLMIQVGIAKEITDRLSMNACYSLGFTDMTSDAYYGNSVKDKNSGIRFVLQYAIIERKRFRVKNY